MSKFITEPERQIPVETETDVLVAGAGPAGTAAAISAARQGAKTVLIEQSGDVGGQATAGLMSDWSYGSSGGIYEEILNRSSDSAEPARRRTINPEKLKTALSDMLYEAGVILKLYTFASGVIMDGNTVKGVITESKAGRKAILAKTVIDATGDGDIAAKAGAEFVKGRQGDGKMQPMSLIFKVAGVDTQRAVFPRGFESNIEIPGGGIQDLGRKHLAFPLGHVLLYPTTLPGVVTCNMTNAVGMDGTNPDDLTASSRLCRKQTDEIVSFLRKVVPGFESCYVISSASQLGVRETRHFAGEYTLTEEDIAAARVFDDWVVTRAYFNFDIHNVDGPGLDKHGEQKHFKQRNGYTIPYRCLLPVKIDNLLLSGRNISGTHKAHSNFRVMPICAKVGQAAGIAAALAARKNIRPRDVLAAEIQEIQRQNGVEV